MKTTSEKSEAFWALHLAPGAFVMPNPWDAGSARMLAGLGFQALATSSGAAAGTLGRNDYGLKRDEALAMARGIVEAVDVPVSADLENGYGDSPQEVAETVRRAAEIGLAGCSIEDARGGEKPYDLGLAVERVAAAVEVVRALPRRFVLTARAENFARGVKDLEDTIARLKAYERAGADVLFAIGLPDLGSHRAVCAAVTRPVNGIGGIKGRPFTVAELATVGVKRISTATALWRAAMTALHEAAREVRDEGTFEFGQRAMSGPELAEFWPKG
jgi:2-methylisocitrate lyase-like PEP mutase family enzyme